MKTLNVRILLVGAGGPGDVNGGEGGAHRVLSRRRVYYVSKRLVKEMRGQPSGSLLRSPGQTALLDKLVKVKGWGDDRQTPLTWY
jgi:hypothetical protein